MRLYFSDLPSAAKQMIFSKDKHGDALLHVAAWLSSAEMMKYLLSELPAEVVGRQMKMRGFNDETPLMRAASNKRDPVVIKVLMEFASSSDPSGEYNIINVYTHARSHWYNSCRRRH